MTAWLETAKAVVIGAVRHPRETTVVLKDKRTGRISVRRKPPKPPRSRTHTAA